MPYIGQGLQQGRRQLHTFTATASQTTFSASYTPGFVDVYQNGILLAPGDYTATNGNSIVLAVGAAVSDEITIIAQHMFSLADVVSASTGGTFSGDVTMAGNLTVQGTTITVDTNTAQTLAMGDADKIKLGDDGDLEIYHSGADSFIDDAGTGSIFIRSGTTYFQNAAGTKTSIQTNAGAGQTLYFNNTSKFQTTDNGALVGDGLGTEVLTILANSSGESQLRFADGTTGTAAYQGRVEYEHTDGKLNLGAGGVTQVTIDSSGNMGLGTNSPTPTASNYDSASFHISQVGSSSVGAQIRFSTGVTGHTAGDGTFMAQWADSNFYITNQEANADIRFNAGGNSDMVVFDGSSGNVGIGTASPLAQLEIDPPAVDTPIFAIRRQDHATVPLFKFFQDSSVAQGTGHAHMNTGNRDLSITADANSTKTLGIYLKTTGEVGIGTASPTALLQITPPNEHQDSFRIYRGGSSGYELNYLNMSLYQGNTVFNTTSTDSSGKRYLFQINGAEKFRIDQNGEVGIGTNGTPDTLLHVKQTATAGNNYDEGTVKVGGASSTLGFTMNYSSLGSGRANLTGLNTSGGINNRISLGFGAIQSYGEPADRVLTVDQAHYVRHTPPGNARFMPMITPQSVTRHGAYPTHPNSNEGVGNNQTNSTQLGFAHVYARNWSGGRYLHMKTDMPATNSNYGMIMVFAKGYRYSPGGTIDSSWGFHNWGNAIYSLDQRNYATTFAVNCYVSSDGYCVLVGDNQTTSSGSYTGFRLDFMYSNTNYQTHSQTANGESHYLLATAFSSSTSGVY